VFALIDLSDEVLVVGTLQLTALLLYWFGWRRIRPRIYRTSYKLPSLLTMVGTYASLLLKTRFHVMALWHWNYKYVQVHSFCPEELVSHLAKSSS